jgi:flagellar biosynthesis protein FlhB
MKCIKGALIEIKCRMTNKELKNELKEREFNPKKERLSFVKRKVNIRIIKAK